MEWKQYNQVFYLLKLQLEKVSDLIWVCKSATLMCYFACLVSWADLIAVAGAEAVSLCGGPTIPVALGRLDSK